jgi:hypothetical protein
MSPEDKVYQTSGEHQLSKLLFVFNEIHDIRHNSIKVLEQTQGEPGGSP